MSKSGNYNLGEIEKRDALIQELVKWLEVAHDMLTQAKGAMVFTLGACKNMTEIQEVIAKAKGGAA